jgi:hypothetical protein
LPATACDEVVESTLTGLIRDAVVQPAGCTSTDAGARAPVFGLVIVAV